mmetsp:Transcript_12165/g.29414  ORF Transcript_12165/g.29414 Transcript_12165/m.29414 type:complete len:306 (-) Transcript_12165:52-969(-)
MVACISASSTLSLMSRSFSASTYLRCLARLSWIFFWLSRSLLNCGRRGTLTSASARNSSNLAMCRRFNRSICSPTHASYSITFSSHSLLCCSCSMPNARSLSRRSLRCRWRTSSLRFCSSCTFRSCSRLVATRASMYLPSFSHFRRCSSSARRNPSTASSSVRRPFSRKLLRYPTRRLLVSECGDTADLSASNRPRMTPHTVRKSLKSSSSRSSPTTLEMMEERSAGASTLMSARMSATLLASTTGGSLPSRAALRNATFREFSSAARVNERSSFSGAGAAASDTSGRLCWLFVVVVGVRRDTYT